MTLISIFKNKLLIIINLMQNKEIL